VNELCGVKESDTGLAPPALWDIAADKQAMQQEKPLQVESIFQFFYELRF
jgi:26S proteasome regulatory subunit T1